MPQILGGSYPDEDTVLLTRKVSGRILVANNPLRTGDISIGNNLSNGDINVHAGTAILDLKSSNYATGYATLQVADESGNTAVVTGNVAEFQRTNNMVFLATDMIIVDTSGLVQNDMATICNLPYNQHLTAQHKIGEITGTAFNGLNFDNFHVVSVPSTTNCRIIAIKNSNSTSRDIKISDLNEGESLKTTLTYFTDE